MFNERVGLSRGQSQRQRWAQLLRLAFLGRRKVSLYLSFLDSFHQHRMVSFRRVSVTLCPLCKRINQHTEISAMAGNVGWIARPRMSTRMFRRNLCFHPQQLVRLAHHDTAPALSQ
jgi:hypothetical protein